MDDSIQREIARAKDRYRSKALQMLPADKLFRIGRELGLWPFDLVPRKQEMENKLIDAWNLDKHSEELRDAVVEAISNRIA